MFNKKIIKICEQKLIYLNYSRNTSKIYLKYIIEFISSTNKQYSHLNSSDFQDYIDNYNFTSVSQQNQIISSIKFLYKIVLEKRYDKVKFNRPLKEKKLPEVIDKKVLLEKISRIENLKHKTIISLAYSTGLRVSEIINLKIEDIDSKRMILKIIQSKGKKDRIVPLTENILNLLRLYYKKHKPIEYLFNGQKNKKYSSSSCNKIIKKYIGEDYSFPSLRHSCFTHLTEQNIDIRTIQKLAGHSSSKTTEIYTQVSKSTLQNLPLF
jgi:integrase/recombinase XerD